MILYVCLCVYACVCVHSYIVYVHIHIHSYVYTDKYTYRIASNYGLGVYFFPLIFNQATKQDRHLFSEVTHAVYNL